MTAPLATALEAFAEIGVVVAVTEGVPLLAGHTYALMLPTGEGVVVEPYQGEHDPRALLCSKHGAMRHDWNGKKFVCKKCRSQKGK